MRIDSARLSRSFWILYGTFKVGIYPVIRCPKNVSVMESQTANGDHDTDVAVHITEDLVPSRSDQLAETISLDFSGLLNPPLSLKQDLTEGCGGKTWPAGMVLSKYLLRCRLEQLKAKTMFVRSRSLTTWQPSRSARAHANTIDYHRLELGAGGGLVGYAL